MYKNIPKIKTAIALDGYKLELTFEDGVCGIIDMSAKVGIGVFDYWNNEQNFKKFEIVYNALTWNEILDIDCDSFYLQLINQTFFEYAGN